MQSLIVDGEEVGVVVSRGDYNSMCEVVFVCGEERIDCVGDLGSLIKFEEEFGGGCSSEGRVGGWLGEEHGAVDLLFGLESLKDMV